MKKFKKNFSKTVFASFFVFQFVVSTSFMPLIANAEDVSVDSEASSKEEVSDVSKEVSEESAPSEVVEETITEEVVSEESKTDETTSDESSTEELSSLLGELSNEPSTEKVMGQFIDGTIRVCKVVVDQQGNIVSDPASVYPDATFTIPVKGPNFSSDVVFNANEFSSNTTFGFDENAFEAMCDDVTVPLDIPDFSSLTSYSYEEEVVGGNYTWETTYNDGDFNTLSAFAYGELAESDGNLMFTGNMESGFVTTLLVVNKHKGSACDAPSVYARINLENLEGSFIKKENGGLYNTGTGNMAPKVFVGGIIDSPNELGGNVYDIDEWFPIYNSVSGYMNDSILTSTDPGVPGLMVERQNGQVRVVLYGSHSQPAGSPETNREMANGFVEFSNDQSTVSSDVEITGQVVDLQNPPEMNPSSPIDGPNNDYISFTSNKSNFKFVVTTHNDGMYTLYTHTLPPSNCDDDGDENQPPVVNAPSTVCILKTDTSYDFLSGVTAFDAEDGNLTPGYIAEEIRFGVAGGPYMIWYSATDSKGIVAGATTSLFIKEKCDDNGGGKNEPPIIKVVPNFVCISTSVQTYDFLNGVTAVDPEDGILIPTYTHDINFGTEGIYTIYYKATDRDLLSTLEYRTLVIKENCGGEGEGVIETISVCKIIARDVNGNLEVVSGNEVPGYTFTIPWVSAPTTPGTEGFVAQPIIEDDAVFTTDAFVPNRQILADSNGNDAMCVSFTDLTLGSYFYGKEIITGGDGSIEWTTKYSDQVLNPVNDFDDVFDYDDGLFTVGFGGGSTDYNGNPINTNADGHVLLINSRKVRTIVVVNTFKDDTSTNTIPKIVVDKDVCLPLTATSYDFRSGVTANDAEDGDITSDITITSNNVVFGTAGSYTVVYSVTDSDGATVTLSRTIYIKDDCGGGGDSKSPILTIPGQSCIPTGVTSIDFNAGVSATDDEGSANVTITNNGSTVVNFGTPGTYTVTYTATDSDGNTDVETRTIVISTNCNGGGDEEDPTITFGGQSCILTSATSFDFTSGVTVTDDEGAGNVTVTNNSATAVTFGTAGTYVVTYTATDSDGNVTTATRTFTISSDCGTGGGDNNPPTITITGNSCIETSATSFDFLAGVTATDDLDGTITLNLTDNVLGEETVIFGTAGTYTVTYTVTDSLLETTTTTRTITISNDCGGGGGSDNDPTITFGGQSCILTSATSFDFMSGVTVADDEGAGNVIVTNNGASAVTFGTAGSYTVTYIATDSDGNVTQATRTITISNDCGGGGGSDNDPNLAIPSDVCIETSVTSFDFNAGVTATDDEGADNVTITNNGSTIVTFGSNGTYIVVYTATDSDGNTDVVTRTFTISEDCDGGGNGDGGDGNGGNGGGSSSGSRRNNGGEVLGAATCVAFTTYNRLGNSGGEIKALQTFLNEYMDAGLTVDGVYGKTTVQAVHDFQAFHWSEVIDPWTPPLSPNTTGWEYKTTRMTINAIIDCPEAAVYLEDPGVMYQVTEVKDQKSFTTAQMETIYNLLRDAQSGNVLGSSDVNTNTTNIFDPNYDLMYGK